MTSTGSSHLQPLVRVLNFRLGGGGALNPRVPQHLHRRHPPFGPLVEQAFDEVKGGVREVGRVPRAAQRRRLVLDSLFHLFVRGAPRDVERMPSREHDVDDAAHAKHVEGGISGPFRLAERFRGAVGWTAVRQNEESPRVPEATRDGSGQVTCGRDGILSRHFRIVAAKLRTAEVDDFDDGTCPVRTAKHEIF